MNVQVPLKPSFSNIPNMIVYDCRNNLHRVTNYDLIWKCRKCHTFLLSLERAIAHSKTCIVSMNGKDEYYITIRVFFF